MSSPSASIPASSELDLLDFDETPPPSSDNDALEAAELLREETILRNNKEGIVIQHRAWPVPEAFRSEGDYPQGWFRHGHLKARRLKLYRNTITTEPFISNPTFVTSDTVRYDACLIAGSTSSELFPASKEAALEKRTTSKRTECCKAKQIKKLWIPNR